MDIGMNDFYTFVHTPRHNNALLSLGDGVWGRVSLGLGDPKKPAGERVVDGVRQTSDGGGRRRRGGGIFLSKKQTQLGSRKSW